MHVGVVAYEMEGARSGVGRYLEGLLGGLGGVAGWRWTLFMKGEPFEHALFEAPAIDPVFDRRADARPIWWEQTRLPSLLRRHDLDLLFSPGYSLPPGTRAPQVVTLHDLSFEHMRREFRWREGLRRRLLARRAARRAARVLADTHAMAADLTATYGIPPDKIGVVPLAVEERFFEPEAFDLAKLGLEKPYLLCLGSILPRRHLDLVIEAFARAAPDHRLVIAGRDRLPEPGRLDRWIEASPARDRILRLPYVPEPALPALYAEADASLYLSTYEGYGLPPLESLAAGTPALVSAGMALDDLVPDYPFRTEVRGDSVEQSLREMLARETGEPIINARERLRELTWPRCAASFLTELERAARG